MKTRQILNLATFLIMVVVNGLANALPLNGRLTGEISDSFPVLFTPAGYVFAIWGLIYLLLFGFVIYQALPSQRDNPRLERTGYWFAASNLFNTAWIFLWHYGFFTLTLVAMLGVLSSLLVLYVRLGIGRGQFSLAEKILVNLPFSVYLGWISVATVANFSITLYNLGWNGGGIAPAVWTVALLAVAAILGAAMIWLRRDAAYALVLVWAFAGITIKQSETQTVAVAAAAAAAVILVLLAVSFFRRDVTENGRNTWIDQGFEA
jgi:benzodiazapine receptor